MPKNRSPRERGPRNGARPSEKVEEVKDGPDIEAIMAEIDADLALNELPVLPLEIDYDDPYWQEFFADQLVAIDDATANARLNRVNAAIQSRTNSNSEWLTTYQTAKADEDRFGKLRAWINLNCPGAFPRAKEIKDARTRAKEQARVVALGAKQ